MGCNSSSSAKTAVGAPVQADRQLEGQQTISQLTPQERALNQLKLIFDNIDANSDGAVSKTELCQALGEDENLGALIKEAGFNPNYYVLEQLDTNGDGFLAWCEFEQHLNERAVQEVVRQGDVQAVAAPADQKVLSALETIFKSIDSDGSGAVSKAELAAKLNSDQGDSGQLRDSSFEKLIAEAGFNPKFHCFEKLDTNGDEKITWEEFLRHLKSAAEEEVKATGEVAAAISVEAVIEIESKKQVCGLFC